MQTVARTNVVNLHHYRVSRGDALLNAEWDRLMDLVEEEHDRIL